MQKASVQPAKAKNALSGLIDRVSQSEDIVISRCPSDVAGLAPIGRAPRGDISEAIAKMRATAADSSHFLAIPDALPVETDQETNSRAGTASMAPARSE